MGYYGLDVVDPEEALRLTDLRHNSDAFNMVYERRSVFAVWVPKRLGRCGKKKKAAAAFIHSAHATRGLNYLGPIWGSTEVGKIIKNVS